MRSIIDETTLYTTLKYFKLPFKLFSKWYNKPMDMLYLYLIEISKFPVHFQVSQP